MSEQDLPQQARFLSDCIESTDYDDWPWDDAEIVDLLDQMADEIKDLNERLHKALEERDSWRLAADSQLKLRQELEQLLGVEGLEGEAQFQAAVEEIERLRHSDSGVS